MVAPSSVSIIFEEEDEEEEEAFVVVVVVVEVRLFACRRFAEDCGRKEARKRADEVEASADINTDARGAFFLYRTR